MKMGKSAVSGLLLALTAVVPVAVQAADMAAPVNEIMQAAVNGWSENPQPDEDYFSQARLARLYSDDFVKIYRAAAKFPAYDEGVSPFDYDVIVSGQDSCSLKDLAITPGAAAGGRTDVRVTFDNTHCFGERAADWKPAELHFMVVEQGGKAVIDDIVRATEAGSLKTEMEAIASQGAKQ